MYKDIEPQSNSYGADAEVKDHEPIDISWIISDISKLTRKELEDYMFNPEAVFEVLADARNEGLTVSQAVSTIDAANPPIHKLTCPATINKKKGGRKPRKPHKSQKAAANKGGSNSNTSKKTGRQGNRK